MEVVETSSTTDPVEVDVLVVGAGMMGLYQLYRAREEGYSVRLIEAGSGVGGTWYWNRYPEARFDSESYTYAFLFSKELFHEWRWSEHFAGQPEIERYLNHAIDKFDMRRHMTFNARVTSAVWDEDTGTYTVTATDGSTHITRYLFACTGVLSLPYFPEVPGREDFTGEAYHTGLWPKHEVDFDGKRVAVIGTGASGVQLIPAIADKVASMTVYQRTPNWCTPLNNRPITEDEQEDLRLDFEAFRHTLNTSPGGFLHVTSERKGADDPQDVRQEMYEKMWTSPGFSKLGSVYNDLLANPEINDEFCEFISAKVRGIVKDPATADKLIPKDHKFAQKRPPFITGYYDAYNNSKVSLVALKETPIVRVTETGIETTEGHQEFDIIVWATGFDFGTGSLNRMGVRGRDGLALEKHWEDGPTTFLGVQTAGFPNFFFPGGPHGAAGNNPRYGGDQTDFAMDILLHMREHGYDIVEVTQESEDEWTNMVDTMAQYSPFGQFSYFYGSNIPGKPRRFLLNPAGRPKLLEWMAEVKANEFKAYHLSRSSEAAA